MEGKKTYIYVAPKKENKIGNALIHTIEITNNSIIFASFPNKLTAVHFKRKCPTENRFMTYLRIPNRDDRYRKPGPRLNLELNI